MTFGVERQLDEIRRAERVVNRNQTGIEDVYYAENARK
jgi:hypothetical protein